jgi:hypothetical protein
MPILMSGKKGKPEAGLEGFCQEFLPENYILLIFIIYYGWLRQVLGVGRGGIII